MLTEHTLGSDSLTQCDSDDEDVRLIDRPIDSMINAQVCLRLATIKGHSEICSFALLGGQKTSQYLV